MRIAHISDQHFGTSLLDEADRCMGAAVDETIRNQVDAVALTGDLTAHAMEAHCPALHAAFGHVRRLADHVPVLVLQGTLTHEPAGCLSLLRHFGGRFPIYVAERMEQVALMDDGSWVPSQSWAFDRLPKGDIKALFTCIPAVNKAQVAATVGALAAGFEVGEQLARLLAAYGPINAAARRRGIPTIGVGHGTVSGCVTEHGMPMVGLDHEFGTGALFAADCDAFMLGHIHQYQAWERDGRIIAYAGSTGRFRYGEPGAKGFLLWDVAPGHVRAQLVPTPARRTLDLVFAGPPELNAIEQQAANGDLAGTAVRVRWTVNEEDSNSVDRAALTRLLHAAGATEVKLEGRVIPVQRTRAPGIAQAGGIGAQIQAWAQVTGSEPAPLLDCLAQLQESNPEAIAHAILGGPAQPAPRRKAAGRQPAAAVAA